MLGCIGCNIARYRLRQGRRRAFRGFSGICRRRLFEPCLAAFEQRVLLDLRLDVLRQIEVGKLQHLDRLLQLGCHDQRLSLAQLKSLRISRPAHIPLRSGAAYRLNLSPR